jgi:hypothetical protein
MRSAEKSQNPLVRTFNVRDKILIYKIKVEIVTTSVLEP